AAEDRDRQDSEVRPARRSRRDFSAIAHCHRFVSDRQARFALGFRGRRHTMVQLADETAGQPPKDLVGFLNFYLVTKAPIQIPEGGREALVRWGPWVLVVLLVITLPAALFILGLGALIAPFAGVNYATGFGLSAIGLLVTFALEAAALPGLFARKMSGWNLL